MSDFEEFQDSLQIEFEQEAAVDWLLTHANHPIPASSIDMSDAINIATQSVEEGGLGRDYSHVPGVPHYPYVGDFKQPKD